MIKVFSYDQMKNYISSNGIDSDEYYISILSTGGPYGIPIFKQSPNIFTMSFDDVQADCLKSKYPDGIGLRWAKAMTTSQADDLCEFIRKIPDHLNINVHCAWGHSRSKAIAFAIENKPNTSTNLLVYTLIKERLHK
jgi:predicted protein tyrosine phosphatase